MAPAQRIGDLRHRVRWERRGLAPAIDPTAEVAGVTDAAWGDTETAWDDTEATWLNFGALGPPAFLLAPPRLPGDGAGNLLTDWHPRATLWADIRELRGGEAVMAARLEDRQTALVIVRASALTRTIAAADRLIDLANDRPFNIRSAPPPDRRGYITLLCESGVADG